MILAVSAMLWEAIGFVGQGLFTARFLVQWLASEKKGESVVPVSFWWLSVGGSAILALYAGVLNDPVFLLGSLVNGFLYARNLLLIYVTGRRGTKKRVLVPTTLAIAAFLVFLNLRGLDPSIPVPWLVLGFVGAALWTGRFVIQWFASERAGKSVMPRSFWYVGLAGSVLLLSYSVFRQKPVFILGYLFPPVPYIRNLVLIYRKEGAPWLVRRAGEFWGSDRSRRVVIVVACVLLAGFVTAHTLASAEPPGNFTRYHDAGKLVLHGQAASLYDGPNAFRDPPAFAAFLAPLGALPPRVAEVLWSWLAVFSFVGLLAVCRAFTRSPEVSAGWTFVTFLLTIRFGWDAMNLGEAHAPVALLATAGIWLAETGRPRRAGLLTGLAAAMKVFALRGRWRAADASLVGLVLFAVVLPALVFGPGHALDLAADHATGQGDRVFAGGTDVPGVSLKAISFRIFGPARFQKPGEVRDVSVGLLDAEGARLLYGALVSVALSSLGLFARLAKREIHAPLVAGAALAVAVLCSPEAREPEFIAVALLVTALTSAAVRARFDTLPAKLVFGALLLALLLAALPARAIVGRAAANACDRFCAVGVAAIVLVLAVPLAARLNRASSGSP